MISNRPESANFLGKSKSSGNFRNYRTGKVLKNFEHYYDAPAPDRPLTATLGYSRSLKNMNLAKHRVRITSKKNRR